MAISFVGVGTASSGTGAITPAYPAGILAGDFLILSAEASGAQTYATPSGWTLLASRINGNAHLLMWWKLADGTESGTLNIGDSGDHGIACITAWRGVWYGYGGAGTAGDVTQSGTSPIWPAFSYPDDAYSAGSVLVNTVASSADVAGGNQLSAVANANLSSITEAFDLSTTDGDGGVLAQSYGTLIANGFNSGQTTGTMATTGAMVLFTVVLYPLGVRVISSPAGSYTLTGTAVVPKLRRNVAADAGSYALTGTLAALTKSGAGTSTIVGESGSYALTGTAAIPTHTIFGTGGDYFGNRYFGNRYFGDRYWGLGEVVAYSVTAAPGSYLLTGHDVALQRTGHLALSPLLPGAYTLAGTTAMPRYAVPSVSGDYFGNRYFGKSYFGTRYWGGVATAYSITADVPGSYLLTGHDQALQRTSHLALSPLLPGAYELTGIDAVPFITAAVVTYVITADVPGSYLLTGHDQALQRTSHLALSPLLPGEYILTGTDAVPFITAVPVPLPIGVPGGGGKSRRRWVKGAPYPWLQVPQDDDLDEPLDKVKVTLPLVKEALEEIQLYDGVPAWWALQNAKRIKREIPDYVYVPEREDHVAVLHAIMQKIAEDAIAKRLAEERDDEEALLLLLS